MSEHNQQLIAILLIVVIGTVCAAGFYALGFEVFALFSLGLIPFAFGCWGLSIILAGSRSREIAANMTTDERLQLNEMARAYGRRIAIPFLPVVVLVMLLGPSAVLFLPQGPDGFFEYVGGHQWESLAVGSALIVGMVVLSLPAMRKQYRATNDFLMGTEYSRRMGYWAQSDRLDSPNND